MTTRPRRALLDPELQRPSALGSIPRDPGSLWLDKNENFDQRLLALAWEVLKGIPPVSLASYPEAGYLYRKLARSVGVEAEQLLLTPGSDGAIRAAFECFVEDGDTVVHTLPTFAMYPVYCQMFGAKAVPLEYVARKTGPLLEPAALAEAVQRHRPKLLCLPNPDSPTGTVIQPDALRGLLAECEAAGTVLLLDEAYYPFYETSVVQWTAASRNLIVARTFAKAWGAAGLRIGYAVAHPETAALLHKMKPMYEVSTLAVEFMARMLDHEAQMRQAIARIRAGKEFFVAEMRSRGFDVLPTEANYVHVDFGQARETVHAALSGKVLYRLAFDHSSLAGYSRFTVAPRPEMARVVELIGKA